MVKFVESCHDYLPLTPTPRKLANVARQIDGSLQGPTLCPKAMVKFVESCHDHLPPTPTPRYFHCFVFAWELHHPIASFHLLGPKPWGWGRVIHLRNFSSNIYPGAPSSYSHMSIYGW